MASLSTVASPAEMVGGICTADANHASENGHLPLLGMRNFLHLQIRPLNDLQRRRTINVARPQFLFVGEFKFRTLPAFLDGA